MCGMVGMLCVGLCLKKSAFSLSPSSPPSERGEKKGEMRSHHLRRGAGQANAGQCQDCAGDAKELQRGGGRTGTSACGLAKRSGGLRSERASARSER